MNCWQFAVAIVTHTVQLRSGLDVGKRRIAGMGITVVALPTTLLNCMMLARVVWPLLVLILVVAHISLFIETLLRLLRRPLLLSVNLLRMIVIAALLVIVVVLAILIIVIIIAVTVAVIAHHAHFSIFRVALFEQRSLAIFLLILNVGNAVPLLG